MVGAGRFVENSKFDKTFRRFELRRAPVENVRNGWRASITVAIWDSPRMCTNESNDHKMNSKSKIG